MAAVGGTSEATQMYLRTVLELELAGVPPLRARLSERLAHSAPAVSQAVSRLVDDGLLLMHSDDRSLELTADGRLVAEAVLAKHRLAELMLTELAGIEPLQAHAEACNWEHVISDDVEERLRARFGEPPPCPYTVGPTSS